MQITALGGDVEHVLQFAHGETPWGLTVLWENLTELGYLKNGRSDSRIRHLQSAVIISKSHKDQRIVGYKYLNYADLSVLLMSHFD